MDALPDLLRRYLADEPYRRLSDDDLWARFRDHRDEAALRVLLERVGGRVYARCRAILGDEGLADEAFQEAFVELIRHRGKLLGYGPAMAWLYQTATNKARMHRRWWRRAWHRDRVKGAQTPEATAPAAEGDLARREEAEAVAAAVADLPERERRAVELVYLEGMTHDQAAAALGWGRGIVGTYVGRGLDRLRLMLVRRGVAVAGGVAAILTEVAPVVSAGRLAAMADGLWAKAIPTAAPVGGWWLPGKRTLAAGAVVCLGLAAGIGTLAWLQSAPIPDPPRPSVVEAAAVEPETLRAKNERIMRDQLVPRIAAALQEIAPADNPVLLVAVRSGGSWVEAEFRYEKRLAYEPREGGYRFRYCVFRRAVFATTNLTENGNWAPIPAGERLSWVRLAFPLGGRTFDHSIGVEQWARIKAILNEMPADDRAEREDLAHMFGPPDSNLQLPAGFTALTANDRDLFVMYWGNVYAWSNGGDRWRYCGRGLGGHLAADDSRLYGTERGVVWSRPIDRPDAPWEEVCDGPPNGVHLLAVAEGTMYCTTGKPGECYQRLLKHPRANWIRSECSTELRRLFAMGPELFFAVDDLVLRWKLERTDSNLGDWWQLFVRLPTPSSIPVAWGDRLLAVPPKLGPIHARPLTAGPDVSWEVVGRVYGHGQVTTAP